MKSCYQFDYPNKDFVSWRDESGVKGVETYTIIFWSFLTYKDCVVFKDTRILIHINLPKKKLLQVLLPSVVSK